jgi:MoCo/4Fe-4S cofactor protein with predicted Tat translocation signal
MSKRILQHPTEPADGMKYWRSTGQLAETPESKAWVDREFQTGASELNPEVGRRGFVKYMAASAALAGLSLSACRREQKNLVPFSHGVEWSVPGKAVFYATSRPHRRGAQPLVATTFDGRPTKVDGNPFHPASLGTSNTQTQASLLDLYDPDRSRIFQLDGKQSDEATFQKWLTEEVLAKAGDGTGVAFLTEHFTSPTYLRLKDQVSQKLPKAIWATYEPLGGDDARVAHEAAFGAGLRPVPQIEKADVILALDSDFLGPDEGSVATTRAFSARRKPEQKMNRLYVVEHRYTTTGGMADHRLRVQASQVASILRGLAERLSAAGDAGLKGVSDKLAGVALPAGKEAEWLDGAAKDLLAQKGKALVLVGYRQPAAVQALGHAINAALGSLGQTIVGRKSAQGTTQTIVQLAEGLKAKTVKTLFVLGGNPIYNAPVDLNFAALLRDPALTVVRHGYYEDETTYTLDDKGNRAWVKWHVPAAHYLEAWGDGFASDGSLVAQQPMILPLFGGWSEIQLLNFLATGTKPEGMELVQETFKAFTGSISTESWAAFLRDGFVKGAQAPTPEALAINGGALADLAGKYVAAPGAADSYEVVFTSCPKVDDGRGANNAWLQELPDPITKLTWDNAAIISPATAQALGMEATQGNGIFHFDNGEWISITIEGRTLEIPVMIVPGTADKSITIPLGYGRTSEGRVGGREGNFMSHGGIGGVKGPVGFNGYLLRSSTAMYIATGAKVAPVKRAAYKLAITQEHGALEGRGVDILREGTAEGFAKNAGFAKDHEWLHEREAMDAHAEAFDKQNFPVSRSAYTHPELTDQHHQWAMAIDLSVCTGCSACMVACHSENNIPVVGKEQVLEGRELHWIRMDRYFATPMNSRHVKDIDIAEPRMVMQPMPCQHCEKAPCETVCPVNATVHSDDGLNIMAYNRCIGTRYCANNCPFKVRRFNFFDFNERQKDKYFVPNLWNEKGMAESLQLSKNPNVTVRMRGVMEKCTFCVQRIQEAKIAAKVKARDTADVQVPTDSFQVACQQVCSSGAITFGNMNDAKSGVAKSIANPRTYRLFDYLGVKPRVHYLARIMNPNLLMPKWAQPIEELDLTKQETAKGGTA